MFFYQQNHKNLERYIELKCDVSINSNIFPCESLITSQLKKDHDDLSAEWLIEHVCNQHFTCLLTPDISFNELALIKTKAIFKYTNKSGFESDSLYKEYTKYKDKFTKTLPDPIILLHPVIFSEFIEDKPEKLYQFDGMHRVMSALEAGINELDAFVIVRRKDIGKLISPNITQEIFNEGGKCTWFPRYQQIREVNIEGQRVQEPRYTEIYDFSILKDKTVVDFGGNIGQSAVESYFNEVDRFYNFDIQRDALNTADKVFKVLNMSNCSNHFINFNLSTFKDDVMQVISGWDWCIFQAIYRTKEINDIKTVFRFIVENTKEGIIFEGNGEPTIDTNEFYYDIFDEFNFKSIQSLGLCQQRPAYILSK
jgi:hypothetical protein